MKISKVSLIAVLVAATVLAYSPALRAQEKERKRDRPAAGQRQQMMKERLDKMSQDLKLNEEQKKKVEALMKAQGEKMRGLRDVTPEERREKANTMREEMDKKMKEILTTEQYQKWQKMRREGRGAGGFGGQRKGGGKKSKQ